MTGVRGFKKYNSYKIILGTIPYRRVMKSDRNNYENINKTKDRQLAGQTSSMPLMNKKMETLVIKLHLIHRIA